MSFAHGYFDYFEGVNFYKMTIKTNAHKKHNFAKEKVYNNILLESLRNELKDDNIADSIENIFLWDYKKAIFNKYLYYTLTIISIISIALIPVVNVIEFDFSSLLVALFAATSVTSVSITNLLMSRESWYRYRKYTEDIRRECIQYLCGCGDYKNKNNPDLNKNFFMAVQKISALENIEWLKDRQKNTNEKL